MKFQMLAMGDRFEFDGQVYVKTGPLTAMGESGGQRMIPRYAVLKPLTGAAAPARVASRQLDEAAVLAALADYHQRCAALIARVADAAQAPALAAELEAARAACMAALSAAHARD